MNRTVAIKVTFSNMKAVVTVQNTNVQPGFGFRDTMTTHVIGVPESVTDLEVAQLYDKTGIHFGKNIEFRVPFHDLRAGGIVMVTDNSLNASDLAKVLGVSPQHIAQSSIRSVKRGKNYAGHIPAPTSWAAGKPLWDKSVVTDKLYARGTTNEA